MNSSMLTNTANATTNASANARRNTMMATLNSTTNAGVPSYNSTQAQTMNASQNSKANALNAMTAPPALQYEATSYNSYNNAAQTTNTSYGNSQQGGAKKSKLLKKVKSEKKVKRYEECTVVELKEKAAKRKLKAYSSMRKDELIKSLRALRM